MPKIGKSCDSAKAVVRLFTCGQAHSETWKCTADQNLSVAKVETKLREGGEEGGAPVQSADRHTPQPQKMTEWNKLEEPRARKGK